MENTETIIYRDVALDVTYSFEECLNNDNSKGVDNVYVEGVEVAGNDITLLFDDNDFEEFKKLFNYDY